MADTSFNLQSLDDAELSELITAAREELHRRRLEAADIDALIEDGFDHGFTSRGLPKDPWVRGGIVVCPGGRIDRSSFSHDCAFVHIGENWVWEAPERIHDAVRNLPGPKAQMRSVTLVVAHEGLEVDLISSTARTGVHQMKQVRSFVVRNEALELVSARAPKTRHHER